MTQLKWMIPALWVSIFALTTVAAVPQAGIPLMTKPAPTMDGVIHEEEWAGAMRVVGLIFQNDTLDPRHAAFWLGSDGTNIYIAMRSELPPGGRILRRAKADKDRDQILVIHDDAIELWIDPHRGKTSGDRRYFQVIANANGALYDVAFDPANTRQKSDTNWRVKWTFASDVKEDHWDVEIAIPLSSIGATKEDLDHPWGVRICRDWKSPAAQAAWGPRNTAFEDPSTMPVVRWLKDGALVRVMQLHALEDNHFDLKLQLDNPSSAAQDVKLQMDRTIGANAPVTTTQVYHLAPGQTQSVTAADSQISGQGQLSILATGEEGEPVYFQRQVKFQIQRPDRVWTAAEEAAKAVALDIGFYPYAHKLLARLDLTALPGSGRVTGASLSVRSKKGGEVLTQHEFPPFREQMSEQTLDLPELPDGDYVAEARLEGQNISPEPITRDFARRHFEWENNSLGISDQVIPPFTPLEVKGQTVSAVLRDHEMSDQGLWQQVIAEGEPILAEPIHFEAEVDGKAQPLTARTLKFTARKPNEVTAESSWSAGPIRATLVSNYDYDGMMKATLHLDQQGDATVNQLDLVIPIRKETASLMHIISDAGARIHYSGAIPAGQGVIWESKSAAHPQVSWDFAPYIWIGDELRGVCWFADSPRDWLMDPTVSMQRIERRDDGAVVLRVRLVTRPGALKRPRTIVFGLQATPTKPMPQDPIDWRRWTFRSKTAQTNPNLLHLDILGSCYRWGAYTPFSDFYPRKQDFSIYDTFYKARQTGQTDPAAIKNWLAGYDYARTSRLEMTYAAEVQTGARQMAAQPDVAIPYTNARGAAFTPAFMTFQAEWLIRPFPSPSWPTDEGVGLEYECTPAQSYQDFALWYFNKMLTSKAFDGIYFDNVYLLAVHNRDGAWKDDQGKTWPSYNLFSTRQFIKRAAVLSWQHRRGWFNMAHMTSTFLIPIDTWVGMNLDWEWHYGMDDFQDRFPRDYIRTESIGHQSGSVPVALGGISGEAAPERKAFVVRTQVGVSAVHGVKVWNVDSDLDQKIWSMLYEFGYGQPDCHNYFYWQKPFPATLKGTDAQMLLLSRGGKALLLVTSFGESADGVVTLDAKASGLKPGGTFKNLENGQPLEKVGDFSVKFSLPKHDFRIIGYE